MKISDGKNVKDYWDRFINETVKNEVPVNFDTLYAALYNDPTMRAKPIPGHPPYIHKSTKPEGFIRLVDKDIEVNKEKSKKKQQKRIDIMKKMEQDRRKEENNS